MLATLFVLEANFVVSLGIAALGTPRLDAALRLVVRQSVWRFLIRIVNTTDDNGLVRIAVEKVDNHLLADTRDVHGTPLLPRPHLRDAYPTRAVFVEFVDPIPEKLHLDPAVNVGPDFFAGLADHHRR